MIIPRALPPLDPNDPDAPAPRRSLPMPTNASPMLPILLGILIPITVALVSIIILHRKFLKNQKREDDNLKHKFKDFGFAEADFLDVPVNQSSPSSNRRLLRGPRKTSSMSSFCSSSLSPSSFRPIQTARSSDPINPAYPSPALPSRALSVDYLDSPYLLPPALRTSAESLNSISRVAAHDTCDPYRPTNLLRDVKLAAAAAAAAASSPAISIPLSSKLSSGSSITKSSSNASSKSSVSSSSSNFPPHYAQIPAPPRARCKPITSDPFNSPLPLTPDSPTLEMTLPRYQEKSISNFNDPLNISHSPSNQRQPLSKQQPPLPSPSQRKQPLSQPQSLQQRPQPQPQQLKSNLPRLVPSNLLRPHANSLNVSPTSNIIPQARSATTTMASNVSSSRSNFHSRQHSNASSSSFPSTPLRSLPQPHEINDSSIFHTLEFAPPSTYRVATNLSGRNSSNPRPYVPLTSTYHDLPQMPCPHALRKSSSYTGIEFAPTQRYRTPDSLSDLASDRSFRSNASSVPSDSQSTTPSHNSHSVQNLPQHIVGPKNVLADSLRPKWYIREPA